MTKRGKCDTCRLRKVKCDEVRPLCGSCKKRGRPCTYTATTTLFDPASTSKAKTLTEYIQNTTKSKALSVRRHQLADNGFGTFHTLSLQTELSPRISLPSETLALRWIDLIDRRPASLSSFSIFGRAIRLVPLHLGHCDALDKAATYLLDVNVAYQEPNVVNINRVPRTAATAVNVLQQALKSRQTEDLNVPILVAVLIHYAAECLRGVGDLTYLFHVLALSKIITLRLHAETFERLDISILRGIFNEEVFDAAIAGRISIFDDPKLFKALIHFAEAELEISIHGGLISFVQLPRLLLLIRQCYKCPEDANLREEAYSLAESMYSFYSMSDTNRLFRQVARPKTDPIDFDTLPMARPATYDPIDFNTIDQFCATISFFTYRSVLCGAVTRLRGAPGIEEQTELDLSIFSNAERYDIEAAEIVVNCADYALKPVAAEPPWTALRYLKPLAVSLGAWKRLERRSLAASDDHVRALAMQKFCRGVAEKIMIIWNGLDLMNVVEAVSELTFS